MIKMNCKYCGKEFDALPCQIRQGRKYCSVACGNNAFKGHISPMKGKHHSAESRLKISLHNSRSRLGKTPSKESIKALTDYTKAHGSWNKKHGDTTQRFAEYRQNHRTEIRQKNRIHHKTYYQTWPGYASLVYKNLRLRHNGDVSFNSDEFFSWFDLQPKNCYLCNEPLELGQRRTQMDHIIPVIQGGNGDLSNLRLACGRCNAIKRGYSIKEVIETIEKWKVNYIDKN